MKYPLFSILLMSAIFSVRGQTAGKDGSGSLLSGYRSITLKLEDPQKKHIAYCPFHHFGILDQRPDTTRIGAHAWNDFIGKGTRQIMLSKPASRELSDYLDTRIADKSSPYTALIVIRALWLSDGTYTLSEISKDTGNMAQIKTKIRLKAEVYAEKAGVYTPLFRFDSTRTSRTISYNLTGQDLAGMLNIIADSAAIVLDKKRIGSRQLTLDDIRHFNQARFNPIISSDSCVLARGVYRDFQEFRDNAPSIQNFETTKDKDRLLLYIKEANGSSYYSRDAWGYCDGKNIYIMKDGMLVPAWKEGRAFYLLGQPEEGGVGKSIPSSEPGAVVPVAAVPISGGGGTAFVGVGINTAQSRARRTAALKHIFTVDMDTGKLY